MLPLIITGQNVIDTTYNDTYRYEFPSGFVNFQNHVIAISSINLYFSWKNISSATTESMYNNNTFQYIWDNVLYTVILDDGYYEITDINAFFQSVMLSNGHYLVDGSGNYVYYMEIVTNDTKYSVQFNSYAIPTSLPSGYSNPANMSFPSTKETPQIVINSTNNFGSVIGFNTGTYPTTPQTTDYSKLSDFTPQITSVNSLIVSCNLVKNDYAIPSTLLYAFCPAGTSFGSLITIEPKQLIWTPITNGTFSFLELQFYDQDKNRIKLNDSNVTINLVITESSKIFNDK